MVERCRVAKQVIDGVTHRTQTDGIGADGHAIGVGVASLHHIAKHQDRVAGHQAADVARRSGLVAHLQLQRGLAGDQHVFAEHHVGFKGFASLEALVGAVAHDLQ